MSQKHNGAYFMNLISELSKMCQTEIRALQHLLLVIGEWRFVIFLRAGG
jgi:hypothetical protein